MRPSHPERALWLRCFALRLPRLPALLHELLRGHGPDPLPGHMPPIHPLNDDRIPRPDLATLPPQSAELQLSSFVLGLVLIYQCCTARAAMFAR
eukprot:CAMPEP_0174372480 /NCGR_PEP_ID=MMETSP0811_2-20130205/103762_1 /TAXON_ID=73025 ORGANISM="Eutreptiella gymnastica-like, Strain CCMP1594" /NCGR_SAMPLE_ID=MMETSP0811_2 /ASSEMBLY_ACC=CAM_ASM_000667 /LENGTH=93 /DNA_ID=CAMNT_0015519953 /DNA_START=851 /DNA_END=1129 /DNA_ORIENTATION=+